MRRDMIDGAKKVDAPIEVAPRTGKKVNPASPWSRTVLNMLSASGHR